MALITAVTIFHPVPDVTAFDWALAVTSSSEELLHRWLDGTARQSLLADGPSRSRSSPR